MMTDHVDQLITLTEHSYRGILARSWALLAARTPPDDAAAVGAASDLQCALIQTGAAWLALCERVRALEQEQGAVPAVPAAVRSSQPTDSGKRTAGVSAPALEMGGTTMARTTKLPPADATAQEPTSRAPARRRRPQHPAQRRRRRRPVAFRAYPRVTVSHASADDPAVPAPVGALDRSMAVHAAERVQERDDGAGFAVPHVVAPATGVAQGAAETIDAALPWHANPASVPRSAPSDPVMMPRAAAAVIRAAVPPPAVVPGTGVRVFPLLPGAVPARGQLVAMAFNGAAWLPIVAWRRLFEQVLQRLQRSDPGRFAEMAAQLTLHNGRLLFNRERAGNLGPIDAGGGWYTTGQMPTELILQRLRRVLEWWDVPATALEVELIPVAVDAARLGEPARMEPVSEPAAPLPPGDAPRDDQPAAARLSVSSATRPATRTEVLPQAALQEPDPQVPIAAEPELIVVAPAAEELGQRRAALDDPVARGADPASAESVVPLVVPEVGAVGLAQAVPAASRHVSRLLSRRSRMYTVPTPALLVDTAVQPARSAPPTDTMAPAASVAACLTSEAPTGVRVVAPEAGTTPRPPGSPAVLAQADVPASSRPNVPDEVQAPPPRRSSNVRWVKTASGTSLPLRPSTSDD